MKGKLRELLLFTGLGVVVPWLIVYFAGRSIPDQKAGNSTVSTQIQTEAQTQPHNEDSRTVWVELETGGISQMKLDDYITGVVLAEMPWEFEKAALKAQAVAARTYTLKHSAQNAKHTLADVCTAPSCCQAYLPEAVFYERGGTLEAYQTVRSAVEETSEEVLVYQDELIEATYFSCSGGMTEAASAVWGGEIPYLIAQPSPGEESANVFIQSFTLSQQEFLKKLGIRDEDSCKIGDISYTDGKGVSVIQICGFEFTGQQMRSLLSLPSTSFSLSVVGDSVIITAKGFGHRVGLSQYGAEAMAVQGSTYDQILAYYYPGTELATLSAD